jgi:hypothetical protein
VNPDPNLGRPDGPTIPQYVKEKRVKNLSCFEEPNVLPEWLETFHTEFFNIFIESEEEIFCIFGKIKIICFLSYGIDLDSDSISMKLIRNIDVKVPKCEIFNLLDSRNMYTIKPSWVADFGTGL